MKAKKTRLEEIANESTNISSSETKSYREYYEDRFRKWLDSDVELIQVTARFRLKTLSEAAQLAVNYFVTESEMNQPLVISGLAGALRLGSCTALDTYKTYHPDYADLIEEAKLVCEQYAEKALFSKNSSGAKFVLMNRNKWSNVEKQEVTTHNIDVRI